MLRGAVPRAAGDTGAPGAPGLGALLHGCCVPLRPGGPTVPYRRPRASRCPAEAPGDGRRPAAGEHRHAERRGKSLSSLGCPGLQPNSRGDAQPLRPTRISLTRTRSLPPPPGGHITLSMSKALSSPAEKTHLPNLTHCFPNSWHFLGLWCFLKRLLKSGCPGRSCWLYTADGSQQTCH